MYIEWVLVASGMPDFTTSLFVHILIIILIAYLENTVFLLLQFSEFVWGSLFFCFTLVIAFFVFYGVMMTLSEKKRSKGVVRAKEVQTDDQFGPIVFQTP